MRVLVATDAWRPQVNGVVRSIEALGREAGALGAEIAVIGPDGFPTMPLPTYGDIAVALPGRAAFARAADALRPDHVHIATEGPIGLVARGFCQKRGLTFTTSYHTQFPDYVAARLPVPRRWTYAALRWFHGAGAGTMVPTRSVARELARRGFGNLMAWSRGVDAELFRPRPGTDLGLPRPVFLYVGRVAVEKNLPAFLGLDLPGSKMVCGEGPALAGLRARYPDVTFLGLRTGEALARTYAAADVFVFPSRTDTFGIVLLEALASGLPVAAFPVAGPADVVGTSGAGVLDEDLRGACLRALGVPRDAPRALALRYGWAESARQFLDNVAAVRPRPTGA